VKAITRYRSHGLYRGLTLTHAEKGGGPVLKDEASWRTINGLMVTFRGYNYMFLFRRVCR
jgi:hypothetical protein